MLRKTKEGLAVHLVGCRHERWQGAGAGNRQPCTLLPCKAAGWAASMRRPKHAGACRRMRSDGSRTGRGLPGIMWISTQTLARSMTWKAVAAGKGQDGRARQPGEGACAAAGLGSSNANPPRRALGRLLKPAGRQVGEREGAGAVDGWGWGMPWHACCHPRAARSCARLKACPQLTSQDVVGRVLAQRRIAGHGNRLRRTQRGAEAGGWGGSGTVLGGSCRQPSRIALPPSRSPATPHDVECGHDPH